MRSTLSVRAPLEPWEVNVTPSLQPNEQSVLAAAATIFAAVTSGEQLDDAEAKEARKYALKQALLLAMAMKELAKED